MKIQSEKDRTVPEKGQKEKFKPSAVAIANMQDDSTTQSYFFGSISETFPQNSYLKLQNNNPRINKLAQLCSIIENHNERQRMPIQFKEDKAGLPAHLKTGVENLSGYSMDDVTVQYNSNKPAQLFAHAFTQGTDIYVAPGQEKQLPHEAWHVVQQKQGRVRPTLHMKDGIRINDEVKLEQEADVRGKKAIEVASISNSPVSDNESFKDSTALQRVIQCVNIVPKSIQGLTHLVKMTEEGHIYNEEYLKNERYEVQYGDLLWVDLDNAWNSRRRMHQEVDPLRDKNKEPDQLWSQVIRLNDEPLEDDVYVRNEMLMEPARIKIPRPREGIDGAIEETKKTLASIDLGKNYYWLGAINSDIVKIQGGLVTKIADDKVNFKKIEGFIGDAAKKAKRLFDDKILNEDQHTILKISLDKLMLALTRYSRPKDELVIGGLIGWDELQYLGVRGINLGGIGIEPGYLDVNIVDDTNDPLHIVIGDAMNLQGSFEPNCTDHVIAVLLPLVDMVGGSDTKHNRIQAITNVLAGVNYLTNSGGKVSIQFNDNSGKEQVSTGELIELATQYRFTVRKDSLSSYYGSTQIEGELTDFRRFTFLRG